MSLIDSIEGPKLGDVGHFSTPSELQQPDTQHAERHAQPCSNTTSQAQPIFLLRTQVLRRGEQEAYRQHKARTGQCGTFQHKSLCQIEFAFPPSTNRQLFRISRFLLPLDSLSVSLGNLGHFGRADIFRNRVHKMKARRDIIEAEMHNFWWAIGL